MTNALTTWRPRFWHLLFFALLAGGAGVTWLRWTRGLGAVTNLSDGYPWGLWVGFDILCGIGLAAGGFLLTAVVYIFNLKRFQPIVRPALLTAFLGYLLEVVALGYDLGRPWNLWRPLVAWKPDSVMYVVAWCVTTYTVVLLLESSGMVFERLKWARALRIQRTVTIPLVIVGVVLSIIHQSSLGSLYLIVPGKLHALWYSPMLPLLFLVSAVAVGLAMVIVESRLSARAFGHQLKGTLLSELGRALFAVIGLYAVIRLVDLWERGALAALLRPTTETMLFGFEFAAGVILPWILLASARRRANLRLLYGSSLLVILGFILNRLNVSLTAFEASRGHPYVPSLGEITLTLMLIAVGVAGFRLAVRHLRVFPHVDRGLEQHAR